MKVAANSNVRRLVKAVADSQSASTESDVATPVSPPVKKAKLDPRAASLKFLSNASGPSQHVDEFDRYLATPVDDRTDVLRYWKDNASQLPCVAEVARKFLSVPATSTASERQFSASGRVVTKLRSRLEAERVETLVFLYQNM